MASRLALFVLASALAGVLVAGLALPVAGSAGLLARASADSFDSMPGDLTVPPLPQNSRVLAADGSVIATFYEQNRVIVPLEQVALPMREAIVAIEDSRFYEHGGIDLRGTLRAFVNNSSGEQIQGGSTITQQYVKNVLLESALAQDDKEAAEAATERSYARKVRELRYAIALEDQLAKDDILGRYLNIAYFGNGAYGVEAAAQTYFDKPAAELTLPEAALIAGLVKNPAAYDPFDRPQAALERRNVVLARMAELDRVSPEQVAAARATKLGTSRGGVRTGCAASSAPFFCDYVYRSVRNDPVFGATVEDRLRLLFRGGVTIRTTLDPRMQRAAQQALAKRIRKTDKVAGTFPMVEPGTGEIKAMAVSRDYGTGRGKMQNNIAVDVPGGNSRGINPGSTFKAFVAAEALRQGYGLDYRIYAPYQLKDVPPIEGCNGKDIPATDKYNPRNELRDEDDVYTMREAMAKSINTYFIQLEQLVGLCDPPKLVERLRVTRAQDPGQPLPVGGPSWTLGPEPVSPLAMASAYAAFGARGTWCQPVAILSATDRAGQELPVPQGRCEQVLEPEIADAMNELLGGVVDRGSGRAADIGRPQAGKTGTHERRTVWFIGYTPRIAGAVAVYNPDEPEKYELKRVTIGGRYYPYVGGFNMPAPIWGDGMKAALKSVPKTGFVAPEERYVEGTKGPGVLEDPDDGGGAEEIVDRLRERFGDGDRDEDVDRVLERILDRLRD